MDEEEQQRREAAMQITRRELERKSRDIIRIYNPTNVRFKWFYDGFPFTIEPKSTKDVERYIARLYFDKMSQYLIGQMAISMGNDLIAERAKKGLPDFLDKYEENRAVWDKVPKLNDPKLLQKFADELILGLVEEYGFDIEPEMVSHVKQADTRSVQEQAFDSMNRKIATDLPSEEKPLKKDLIEEVSLE